MRRACAGGVLFVLLATAASCGGAVHTEVPVGAAIVAVQTPHGEEGDQVGALTDGIVGSDDWYCAEAPAPQVYELMFADGLPQHVYAIGFVPGNLGHEGIGPIGVRVQYGHGVAARGTSFEARPQGRAGRLEVLVLPAPTEGDHVLLTFRRQSQYTTARCLGELTVYTDDESFRGHGAGMVRLRRVPEITSSEAPVEASGAPEQGAAGAATEE